MNTLINALPILGVIYLIGTIANKLFELYLKSISKKLEYEIQLEKLSHQVKMLEFEKQILRNRLSSKNKQVGHLIESIQKQTEIHLN